MKFGARWADLRCFLTWATSPAPLSWLLVGIAFALGVWGLVVGRRVQRAADRVDAGLEVLMSWRCVWIAPSVDPPDRATQARIRTPGVSQHGSGP